MSANNITETLRNYAKRRDVSPMFKCVLAEAAATIESLQKENELLKSLSVPVSPINPEDEVWETCE